MSQGGNPYFYAGGYGPPVAAVPAPAAAFGFGPASGAYAPNSYSANGYPMMPPQPGYPQSPSYFPRYSPQTAALPVSAMPSSMPFGPMPLPADTANFSTQQQPEKPKPAWAKSMDLELMPDFIPGLLGAGVTLGLATGFGQLFTENNAIAPWLLKAANTVDGLPGIRHINDWVQPHLSRWGQSNNRWTQHFFNNLAPEEAEKLFIQSHVASLKKTGRVSAQIVQQLEGAHSFEALQKTYRNIFSNTLGLSREAEIIAQHQGHLFGSFWKNPLSNLRHLDFKGFWGGASSNAAEAAVRDELKTLFGNSKSLAELEAGLAGLKATHGKTAAFEAAEGLLKRITTVADREAFAKLGSRGFGNWLTRWFKPDTGDMLLGLHRRAKGFESLYMSFYKERHAIELAAKQGNMGFLSKGVLKIVHAIKSGLTGEMTGLAHGAEEAAHTAIKLTGKIGWMQGGMAALAGIFCVGPAITAAWNTEGGLWEKTKVFGHHLFGSVLSNALGWVVGMKAVQSLGVLARMLPASIGLRSLSLLPAMLIPGVGWAGTLGITLGGFATQMLAMFAFGSLFEKVGEKLSHLILGKPEALIAKEQAEASEAAQKQAALFAQQGRQGMSSAAMGSNNGQSSARLFDALSATDNTPHIQAQPPAAVAQGIQNTMPAANSPLTSPALLEQIKHSKPAEQMEAMTGSLAGQHFSVSL